MLMSITNPGSGIHSIGWGEDPKAVLFERGNIPLNLITYGISDQPDN
jgi:hypothetical protein